MPRRRDLPLFRTPPRPVTPVPMSDGDGVRFAESGLWWTVRATTLRYVILTAPYTLANYGCAGLFCEQRGPHDHVLYTIIDWERGLRGPDDHYGVGYGTQEDIYEAMARLHGDFLPADMPQWEMPGIEVSHRAHSIRVKVDEVRPYAQRWSTRHPRKRNVVEPLR